jgi:hypothetical protein
LLLLDYDYYYYQIGFRLIVFFLDHIFVLQFVKLSDSYNEF